jgi:O-acetyl-ADP-ribose deacetylase (regulator of RNase III)
LGAELSRRSISRTESNCLIANFLLRFLAFPAISCGIYGYPVREATQVAITETVDFLESNDKIEKIIFTCFSEAIYQAYAQALS